MSTTSSVETPTSPTEPQYHQQRHQHTTTAIVIGAVNKPQSKRTQSSPSANSFPIMPNMSHVNVSVNGSYNNSANIQFTDSLLTPSSSNSSSPSVSASTSAAVHHYQQKQHQQKAKPSQQLHLQAAARPAPSAAAPVSHHHHSGSKRHANVSACSSSSSCCSSSGSVGHIGGSMGAPVNPASVTPAVVSSGGGGVLITQKSSRAIPSDKINLRLILVSGKTKEFLFNPSDSAGDIAQTVFDNWPEDWEREAVSKAEILRLIYQGRFLHCNVTLGALGLPLGKTTVMHLVPRDNLPEPNSQDQRQKSKGGSSRCCSTTCCIL